MMSQNPTYATCSSGLCGKTTRSTLPCCAHSAAKAASEMRRGSPDSHSVPDAALISPHGVGSASPAGCAVTSL